MTAIRKTDDEKRPRLTTMAKPPRSGEAQETESENTLRVGYIPPKCPYVSDSPIIV